MRKDIAAATALLVLFLAPNATASLGINATSKPHAVPQLTDEERQEADRIVRKCTDKIAAELLANAKKYQQDHPGGIQRFYLVDEKGVVTEVSRNELAQEATVACAEQEGAQSPILAHYYNFR